MVDRIDAGGGPQPLEWGGDSQATGPSQGVPSEGYQPPGSPSAPEAAPTQQPLATDPSPSQPAAPPQTYWKQGDPLPWDGSADAPALPATAPPPQVDIQQLHPAVISANEGRIVAHFSALISQTQDPAVQQQYDQQYRLALKEYRLTVAEQIQQVRAYQNEQQQQQIMVNMVPALREMHADELARKTGVPRDMLLVDHFTKQPLWNHQAMERQAQFLAQMGHAQRVQERGGRDAGMAPTGQAAGDPGDIDKMSADQFRQFREQVRKSQGRLLHRVS
jgi:hypothetical protein